MYVFTNVYTNIVLAYTPNNLITNWPGMFASDKYSCSLHLAMRTINECAPDSQK